MSFELDSTQTNSQPRKVPTCDTRRHEKKERKFIYFDKNTTVHIKNKNI